MTIYDKLLTYSKEELTEYLLRFSNDVIKQFQNSQFPDYTLIMKHLDTEILK